MTAGQLRRFAAAAALAVFLIGCTQESAPPPPAAPASMNPANNQPGHRIVD